MFNKYDAYDNRADKWVYFSPSEWDGLVIAGNIAACISFIANSFVLILHGFMLWYKPVIVNRLSLRMIVLSCIFNMLYCACQLVTDDIDSVAFACRVLAFVLISSDTMACMCLAMVGLNLVTIFVLKVSRSFKLELFYYFLIILSGVMVVVVPILVGPVRGPKNPDTVSTCWYHFFFDGRMTKIFNWMWYYGWLLFSLVFAALCAAISIRFVMKRQDNFAGTLDMFTRRNDAERTQINTLKKYTNSNTDIFTKIARRCICYPLVPLISKSWGVGIEIAASQQAEIPYPIFILDRIFSCLLGLMVSCIYFTDPAIGAVLKDFRDSFKKKYVYDYYCVKYQPVSDPKVQDKSQYPRLVKVIPTDKPSSGISTHMRSTYSDEIPAESLFSHGESFISPLDMSHLHPHMSRTPIYHKPEVPAMEVSKTRKESHHNDRRYSVLSVTTISGRVFLPNEAIHDNHMFDNMPCFSLKSNVFTIPMRCVTNIKKNSSNAHRHHHAYSKHSETVETLVPFKFPKTAKFIHWTLVSIFRVSPIERKDSDADEDLLQPSQKRPVRIFHDYTDNSNPNTPGLSESPIQASRGEFDLGLMENGLPEYMNPSRRYHRTGSEGSLRLQASGSKSMNAAGSIKEFPIRKVSSINVASLFRRKLKKEFLSPKTRTMDSAEGALSTVSSGGSRFAKILSRGRSLSFSWNKLAHPIKKSGLSSPPSGPVDSMAEIKDLSSASSVRSKVALDGKINKYAFYDDEANPVAGLSNPTVLAPFPGQLSPRPVPRPRKRLIAGVNDKPVLIKIHSQKTPFSVNDNHLFSLSQLFDGEKNLFEEDDINTTADDIIQPCGVILTPTEEISHIPLKSAASTFKSESRKVTPAKAPSIFSQDEHEGFVEGNTSINYISNWQESDIVEESRVNIYSEPWDIEKQYHRQYDLAHDISFM